MTYNKPTALELYSGPGGLSLGLKRARFDVVAAVDNDRNVGATYIRNHRDTRFLQMDLAKVSGTEILNELKAARTINQQATGWLGVEGTESSPGRQAGVKVTGLMKHEVATVC